MVGSPEEEGFRKLVTQLVASSAVLLRLVPFHLEERNENGDCDEGDAARRLDYLQIRVVIRGVGEGSHHERDDLLEVPDHADVVELEVDVVLGFDSTERVDEVEQETQLTQPSQDIAEVEGTQVSGSE